MLLDDSVSGVFSDEIDKSLNKKHKSTSEYIALIKVNMKMGVMYLIMLSICIYHYPYE